MSHHGQRTTMKTTYGFSVGVALFLCLLVSNVAADQKYVDKPGQQLAVPATFVRFITTPGAVDHIKRPTAVHWDRFHEEILVSDFGNNRVLVFTPSGAYKFEFSLGADVTAPSDIVTDPEGYIYVLGSNQAGHVLYRFDFDGLALGPIPLPTEYNDAPVAPRSVSCDTEGRLYLLDNKARRVLIKTGRVQAPIGR